MLTNNTGISLPMAVWLAADDYDFSPGTDKAISATALLKPVRQILLRERLSEETQETPDVTDRIASRLGHAIHDSIEKSWITNYRDSLRSLGYPESVIDRVRINPLHTPTKDEIPVWLEQRGSRSIMGYRISGKFDLVLDGELHDTKTTSTYSWTSGSKDEDYALQGSIYRWIHQDKITSDHIHINFIFTDWQRFRAKTDPSYPQQRLLTHRVPLLSLQETETWIRNKLRALEAAADLEENHLPRCSDKDLWRSNPVFKYYKNPASMARSTKNFDSKTEAYAFMASSGGQGIVVEVPGKVKACAYCPAFNICKQKDEYDHD
jgi:hypothetical protein